MEINQRKLFFLGIFTLFGFGGIGLAILYFGHDISPLSFLASGTSLNKQILWGSLYGISAAIAAIALISSPLFADEMQFFRTLVYKLAPTYYHAVFYSLCAGIGEELLFRGGIQPYLGIWLTSVIFILLHGYINPFNFVLTLYGCFMILISAGLGYLFEIYGIWSSIVAHFLFDLVMFVFLIRSVNAISEEKLQ